MAGQVTYLHEDMERLGWVLMCFLDIPRRCIGGDALERMFYMMFSLAEIALDTRMIEGDRPSLTHLTARLKST